MTPYYDFEGITIYHGDCREIVPALEADVLVTDPPYGVNIGRTTSEVHGGRYASYDDTLDNFLVVVVPAITTALARVKRGLVFMGFSGLRVLPPYQALGGVFLPAGMGRSAWGFTNFSLCALYGTAPSLEDCQGSRNTGILSTMVSDHVDHPCPKPYEWMTWAVQLASRPGEVVLDPFCGSGTTLQAAKHLGRRAIGIDIEERYCEIAVRRLAQGCFNFTLPVPRQEDLFDDQETAAARTAEASLVRASAV